MQAGLWKVDGLRVRKLSDFECLNAIEERPRGILIVRANVGQGPRATRGVPRLAARHAGLAANAHVQVDHKRHLCHYVTPIVKCGRSQKSYADAPDSFRFLMLVAPMNYKFKVVGRADAELMLLLCQIISSKVGLPQAPYFFRPG